MKADVKRSDTREKEAMDWATEFFRDDNRDFASNLI
jgi:hypothetical protein